MRLRCSPNIELRYNNVYRVHQVKMLYNSRETLPTHPAHTLPSSTTKAKTKMETSLILLRLAPLLTSTTTLMYAFDHHLFFSAFLAPHLHSQSTTYLPKWLQVFTVPAKWVIFLGYPTTLTLALTNYFSITSSQSSSSLRLTSSSAGIWYLCGAAGTVAHFFFAPTALRLLGEMMDEKQSDKCLGKMKEWLDMNIRRELVADIPAWVSFGIAVCKSFRG